MGELFESIIRASHLKSSNINDENKFVFFHTGVV